MNPGLAEQKAALKLPTRYPGEYDDITKEDYEESIIIAKNIIEWAESKIN